MNLIRSLFVAGAVLLAPAAAMAGQLVISNTGKDRLNCIGAGGIEFSVDPGETKRISASSGIPLSYIKCGELVANNLDVTDNSLDHFLLFNGKQTSVVNVLNYPYLPNITSGWYQTMTFRMLQEFIAQDPTVLLNVVTSTNPAFDTYNEANWDHLFGPDGFHALEVDTINLTPLKVKSMVRPLPLNKEDLLEWSVEAVTVDAESYGVPTTGCTNVMFAKSPLFGGVTSFKSLQKFFDSQKQGLKFIADYSGSTSLSSGYLAAFTDMKGFHPDKLLQMVSDPETYLDSVTIERLADMFLNCQKDGKYTCLDKTFKNTLIADQAFADGDAPTLFGYTERASCNMNMNQPLENSTIQQVAFGDQQQPLIFTDAFVANNAACGSSSCKSLVDRVIAYLTAPQTRSWIALGEDTVMKTPRYLLPPQSSFYLQQQVQANNLYKQFKPIVYRSKPMPNNFGQQQRIKTGKTVCTSLIKYLPGLKCLL